MSTPRTANWLTDYLVDASGNYYGTDDDDIPSLLTMGALADALARSGVVLTVRYTDGVYTARVTRACGRVVVSVDDAEFGVAVAHAMAYADEEDAR